jgi:Glutaredoxin
LRSKASQASVLRDEAEPHAALLKRGKKMQYKLFTTPMCPKCPPMKEFLAGQGKVSGEVVNCHTPEGLAEARKFSVHAVPTVVFLDDDGKESRRCGTKEEVEDVIRSI